MISMSNSPQDNHTFWWALNKSRSFKRLSNYLFLHLTSITSLQRENRQSHTAIFTWPTFPNTHIHTYRLDTRHRLWASAAFALWVTLPLGLNKSTHVMTKVIQIHPSTNSRSESLKLERLWASAYDHLWWDTRNLSLDTKVNHDQYSSGLYECAVRSFYAFWHFLVWFNKNSTILKNFLIVKKWTKSGEYVFKGYLSVSLTCV